MNKKPEEQPLPEKPDEEVTLLAIQSASHPDFEAAFQAIFNPTEEEDK